MQVEPTLPTSPHHSDWTKKRRRENLPPKCLERWNAAVSVVEKRNTIPASVHVLLMEAVFFMMSSFFNVIDSFDFKYDGNLEQT